MLKEIKLKAIYINDKDKNHQPYKNKNGEDFKIVMIESETVAKASMYIGKFKGAWDKKLETVSTWKAGDTLLLNIEKNGDFYNFNLPTATDLLESRVINLENENKNLNDRVTKLENRLKTPENRQNEALQLASMIGGEVVKKETTLDEIDF